MLPFRERIGDGGFRGVPAEAAFTPRYFLFSLRETGPWTDAVRWAGRVDGVAFFRRRITIDDMDMKERIIADLTAAMKARETERTSALRMVKAALMNRQIEKGAELTDEEVARALQSLVKQRRDSIEQYRNAGRMELAEKEQGEIAVIEAYLPSAATAEEIDSAVAAAIAATGASTMKEMGLVMKAALANLLGKTADNRMVSELVKKRLS